MLVDWLEIPEIPILSVWGGLRNPYIQGNP